MHYLIIESEDPDIQNLQ